MSLISICIHFFEPEVETLGLYLTVFNFLMCLISFLKIQVKWVDSWNLSIFLYTQLEQWKVYHSLTYMLSYTTNPLQVSLTTLPVRSASAFRASPSRSHRSDPGSVHCPRKAEVG